MDSAIAVPAGMQSRTIFLRNARPRLTRVRHTLRASRRELRQHTPLSPPAEPVPSDPALGLPWRQRPPPFLLLPSEPASVRRPPLAARPLHHTGVHGRGVPRQGCRYRGRACCAPHRGRGRVRAIRQACHAFGTQMRWLGQSAAAWVLDPPPALPRQQGLNRPALLRDGMPGSVVAGRRWPTQARLGQGPRPHRLFSRRVTPADCDVSACDRQPGAWNVTVPPATSRRLHILIAPRPPPSPSRRAQSASRRPGADSGGSCSPARWPV